jgi:hypothetical protein
VVAVTASVRRFVNALAGSGAPAASVDEPASDAVM